MDFHPILTHLCLLLQGGWVPLLLLANLRLIRSCSDLGSTAESGAEGKPTLKSCPQGEKWSSNRWRRQGKPISNHLCPGCCKLILLAWYTYTTVTHRLARNLKNWKLLALSIRVFARDGSLLWQNVKKVHLFGVNQWGWDICAVNPGKCRKCGRW